MMYIGNFPFSFINVLVVNKIIHVLFWKVHVQKFLILEIIIFFSHFFS